MFFYLVYYMLFDPFDILDVIDLLYLYDYFEESGYFECLELIES